VLDLALHNVSLRLLDDISLTFVRSTHTAIVGPPACGASTLLRVIAGEERPDRGTVHIGPRDVTSLKTSQRPLLYATSAIDVPMRWSVEHALVNAVRSRTLDRIDRYQELELAASKWQIDQLRERRIATLSDHERTRVQLARIELRKPAVVVPDRLLRDAESSRCSFRHIPGGAACYHPLEHCSDGLKGTNRVYVRLHGRVVADLGRRVCGHHMCVLRW
jgi:ABC-type sugar transport system ATPase subunit